MIAFVNQLVTDFQNGRLQSRFLCVFIPIFLDCGLMKMLQGVFQNKLDWGYNSKSTYDRGIIFFALKSLVLSLYMLTRSAKSEHFFCANDVNENVVLTTVAENR